MEIVYIKKYGHFKPGDYAYVLKAFGEERIKAGDAVSLKDYEKKNNTKENKK